MFVYFVLIVMLMKNCVVWIILVGGWCVIRFDSDSVVVRIIGLRIEVLNSLICWVIF